MKTLLLMRLSPFQIYCANTLFDRGISTALLIEDGTSMLPERLIDILSLNRLKLFKYIVSNPSKLIYWIQNIIYHKKYYGYRGYHDKRILDDNFSNINSDLTINRVIDINCDGSVDWINCYHPDLVFVFGTRLVKEYVFEGIEVPFVNMHWGWSPDYRGEGLVSALAIGGSKELGVTVHLIDTGSDSGDILYRERLQIDREDNFYSIGLKLAKIGSELFIRVFQKYQRRRAISGAKQDLSVGKLYSSQYMKQHPELYMMAWKRLRAEQVVL